MKKDFFLLFQTTFQRNRQKIALIFFLNISFFSFHCGITQPVRLVDEKEMHLTASLGGGFIPLGILVPIPYFNVGTMYGISKNVTGTANLHCTSLMFGTAGMDIGAATSILREQHYIPEITAHAKLTFFSDVKRKNIARLYPSFTLNGSYSIGETLFYCGADHWYQIHKPLFLFSPFVGSQFRISNALLGQAEMKWLGANYYNPNGIFEGIASVNGYGSVGLYFGVQYRLE